MAYTFDFVDKIISVDSAPVANTMTLNVQDMYSAWKEALYIDGSWQRPAFRVVGGDDAGDNQSLGIWFYLINGWRFRPYAANHTLFINGNLKISTVPDEDVGGSPFVYPETGNIHIETKFSLQSLVNNVSTASALTTAEHNKLMEIPSATLDDTERTLLETVNTTTLAIKTKTDNLPASGTIGGLTTEEHDKLMEIPSTTLSQADTDLLENILEQVTLVYNGQITSSQFKSWIIERTNTVSDNKITQYTAGSGNDAVLVEVTYSGDIPVQEKIV